MKKRKKLYKSKHKAIVFHGALPVRPLLLAAGLLGLPQFAAAAFPADIDLASLNGTNGFRLSGAAAYDSSGRAVSTAGDVNGDGVDDLLIGAPFADPNGDFSGAGASYVVFGGAGVGSSGNLELSALDGTNGFRLSGAATFDFLGFAVSTAGDVNGDGVDDLLIGAPYTDPNGNYSGASYVVFGGAGVGSSGNLELSALNGTNGFRLSGAAAYDGSGSAVSTAGDVNDDGVDDLLIGAPGASANGFFSGASYVVFGQVDTALLCNGKVPTIIGTEGHDVLVGTDGDDVIMGLGGKDIILGHDGLDTICGGDGNDKILAGDGMDWLFGGRGKDLAQGQDNSDVLNGGSGPDVCNGGDGQDRARNCETVIKVP
jgi:Ca2+-binding RTX toxin-like protein